MTSAKEQSRQLQTPIPPQKYIRIHITEIVRTLSELWKTVKGSQQLNECTIKRKATKTQQEIFAVILLVHTSPLSRLGSRRLEDGSLHSQCGTLALGSRGSRADLIHKLLCLFSPLWGLPKGLTQALICFT